MFTADGKRRVAQTDLVAAAVVGLDRNRPFVNRPTIGDDPVEPAAVTVLSISSCAGDNHEGLADQLVARAPDQRL